LCVFTSMVDYCSLYSFPTRRSSDLVTSTASTSGKSCETGMSMSGSLLETARVVQAPLLLTLMVLVAASGCSRGSTRSATAAAAAPPAVVVITAPVIEKSMAVETRAVGNVEPSSTVAVRSQVTGDLLSVDFTEGQEVAAGQILFRIDPRQFEVALQQAEAALARSRAQADGISIQAERARQLLEQNLLS